MGNSKFVSSTLLNAIRRGVFGAGATVLALTMSTTTRAQGLMPVPDVTGATVEAEAVFIREPLFGGEAEYRYTINSPGTAEGIIWQFQLDVSVAERADDSVGGGGVRTYPVQGGAATASMVDDAELLAPFNGLKGSEVVVVGQIGPSGWNGGLNVRGNAVFWAADTSFGVAPGGSLSGLTIRSNRPPTIRQVTLTPHWVLEVEDHADITDQLLEDAFVVEQSLPVTSFTLGPLDIKVGGSPHYSRLATDILRAEGLGWVTDAALVSSLQASLGTARDEVFIGNNGLALAELQNMLDLIDAAAPGVANREFRDLVTLNVEWLIERVPNLRNTFIPVFTATPLTAELEPGDTFTLTMRHFNSALEGNPPLEDLRILVRCAEGAPCANADQLLPGTAFRIDETGEQLFFYVGENIGLDVIEVVENDFEAFERLALITVNWNAESDLVVPAFVPPMILAGEGDTIFVTDRTRNIGTNDVGVPTITRYYISDSTPVDVESATVLGERVVPPLAEGEFSDSVEMEFVIPSGFTGEINFLAACADDDLEVAESAEDNNCSFSEVERELDAAMVVDDPGANTPPVADDQSVVTNEDTSVQITLVAQDDDGDLLSFNIVSPPINGILSGAAPNLTYTPFAGFVGLDSFEFVANDGTEDSNVATVSITVVAVNSAPVAFDQALDTDEGIPIAVTLTGVDDDGDVLTFNVLTVPVNGSLSGTAPNLTYTPNPGFSGTDGFTFVVNDGTVDSNAGTISISVIPVNLAPIADAGPDQTEIVGNTVTLDGSGSSDPDGDLITYSWTFVTRPDGSSASIQDPTTVSPSFELDRTGTYVVQLIVNDGTADSAPSAVTINAESQSVVLVIDEDSIDNGAPPNFFLDGDVNGGIADLGLRTQLPVFAANVGQTFALYTGEVGDEGWFAITTVPGTWSGAGPTSDGLRNYVGKLQPSGNIEVGDGLGQGNDPEALLDKVPGVTPLRSTGLTQLVGQQICAVVQDSDVSINYDPLDGSLKGSSLGRVAFRVLSVTPLSGASSSSLPETVIEVLDANEVCEDDLVLMQDPPVPSSSSEPFDTGH